MMGEIFFPIWAQCVLIFQMGPSIPCTLPCVSCDQHNSRVTNIANRGNPGQRPYQILSLSLRDGIFKIALTIKGRHLV